MIQLPTPFCTIRSRLLEIILVRSRLGLEHEERFKVRPETCDTISGRYQFMVFWDLSPMRCPVSLSRPNGSASAWLDLTTFATWADQCLLDHTHRSRQPPFPRKAGRKWDAPLWYPCCARHSDLRERLPESETMTIKM